MTPFEIYAEGVPLTPELFSAMCAAHDLTYSYSDDGNVWRQGDQEFQLIKKARQELGDSVAVPIWNAAVDKKLNAPYNTQYHWKE